MRMVNAFLSQLVRACPNRFLRPRQNGRLELRLRSALPIAPALISFRGQIRANSTADGDGELPFEDLVNSFDQAVSKEQRSFNTTHNASPRRDEIHIPDNVDYGKWESLWIDKSRLRREADVTNPSSSQLLVDRPENSNDAHLWLCILHHRMQTEGSAGAAAVMEGLLDRGSLLGVKGRVVKDFWKGILDAACGDKDMMQNVWAYGEWLYDKHDVRWPELYMTFISALLRNQRWNDTLAWHLRLVPKFGPDPEALLVLLKRFITDENKENQKTLRSIYLTSHHRRMYDEIIPFLSARGLGDLAQHWRKIFVISGDFPRTSAARRFIRYLVEYWPDVHLHQSEWECAGLGSNDEFSTPLELKQTINLEDPRAVYASFFGEGEATRIPGVPEQPYNDKTTARLFASNWISVDFAINSLLVLNISSIGVLTLQALALREKKCERLKPRLEQLESWGIGVGDSSYSQALRHWVMTDNDNMLKQLLQSDIHPSVFDDLDLQQDLLDSAASTADQSLVELAGAVRVAASAAFGRVVANELLQISMRWDNQSASYGILNTMTSGGFKPFESTAAYISSHIAKTLILSIRQKEEPWVDSRFYATLVSMMLYFDQAPSTSALRLVISSLIRDGRFNEVYEFVRDIMSHYKKQQASGSGTIRVHKVDVPRLAREEGPSAFQDIPTDLRVSNPWHPIQQILKPTTKTHIIRRSLLTMRDQYRLQRFPVRMADGIRLLAKLRDQGVAVDEEQLREDIIENVAEVHDFLVRFCPPHLRNLMRARGRRLFTIQALKNEVNEAWGSDLLYERPLDLSRKLCRARIRWLIATNPDAVAALREALDTNPRPTRRLFESIGILGLFKGVGAREQILHFLADMAIKVGRNPWASPLVEDLARGRDTVVWARDGGRWESREFLDRVGHSTSGVWCDKYTRRPIVGTLSKNSRRRRRWVLRREAAGNSNEVDDNNPDVVDQGDNFDDSAGVDQEDGWDEYAGVYQEDGRDEYAGVYQEEGYEEYEEERRL